MESAVINGLSNCFVHDSYKGLLACVSGLVVNSLCGDS